MTKHFRIEYDSPGVPVGRARLTITDQWGPGDNGRSSMAFDADLDDVDSAIATLTAIRDDMRAKPRQ